MAFIGAVLIVVFIATAILLIGVVLLQDEQGEGLGGIFGGGSATPFGSRSGNVLTRFTTILGAIFLCCSFGIAWVNRSTQSGDVLAAAKKSQATEATNWWNASVNSNQNISGTSSTQSTGTTSTQTSTGGAASTSTAASAPAANAAPSAAAAPAGQAGAAATGGQQPRSTSSGN